MCACMYVPPAALGACRVYMLCICVERPRQRLSVGNRLTHTHTRTRTRAMRRGHSKLKRIVHVIEVLLQNTLLTSCCRAPIAMASDSPAMTLDAAISRHTHFKSEGGKWCFRTYCTRHFTQCCTAHVRLIYYHHFQKWCRHL